MRLLSVNSMIEIMIAGRDDTDEIVRALYTATDDDQVGTVPFAKYVCVIVLRSITPTTYLV